LIREVMPLRALDWALQPGAAASADVQLSANRSTLLGNRTLCLVQFDDRTDLKLGEERSLMYLNELRCNSSAHVISGGQRWRCAYHLSRDTQQQTSLDARGVRAPVETHWQKVFMVGNLVNGTDCDAAVFLDSDAISHTSPLQLLRHFNSESSPGPSAAHNRDFFFTSDPPDDLVPRWGCCISQCQMNAGVWGVLGTPGGRDVMARWQSLYDASQWTHHLLSRAGTARNGWECRGNSTMCRFAHGLAWEQGAFASLLLRDARHNQSLHWVNPKLVSAPCESTLMADLSGSQSCHFLGNEYKPAISSYLESVMNVSLGIEPRDFSGDRLKESILHANLHCDCPTTPSV